jgi:hypothetical protein
MGPEKERISRTIENGRLLYKVYRKSITSGGKCRQAKVRRLLFSPVGVVATQLYLGDKVLAEETLLSISSGYLKRFNKAVESLLLKELLGG